MEKIRLGYENGEIGTVENLTKEETKQKILELFNKKEITEVKIIYKKEPVQLCTSSKN